ncbi:Lateral signaling target protein 2 [Cichlidogyrus casuarinus]|uniref:Lateral signaling target protein 2 n=1 Tax=Cichlidogyrus casuarinus TaxID=1844966 RepID=A0ABD2PWU9_9PLAT
MALNIMKQYIPAPPNFVHSQNGLNLEPCESANRANCEFLRNICLSQTVLHELQIMDDTLARFEWSFVQYVCKKVRSKLEAEEMQELTVLFSETLMWALAVGIINPIALEDRDPVILLCLPRLAILVGCRLLPQSPIGIVRLFSGQRMPKVFRSNLADLSLLNRQLCNLSSQQWRIISIWLGPNGLPTSVTRLLEFASSDNGNGSKNLSKIKKLAKQYNFEGLHWLYKKVSSLADSISGKHSPELRFILQKAIEMNDSVESVQETEPESRLEAFFQDELQQFLSGEFEDESEKPDKSSKIGDQFPAGSPWWECDWNTTVLIGFANKCKKIPAQKPEMGVDVVALINEMAESSSEDIYCHDGKLRELLGHLLPDESDTNNMEEALLNSELNQASIPTDAKSG